MASTRQWFVAVVALTLMGGCLSNPVPRGAVIGALSGAALGAGTGVLISNATLLGSNPETKLQLSKAESVGAATLIGGVFGAVIGAMIGHQRESDKPEVPASGASAQTKAPSAF
jgi:ABC-type Fe3+-siderophore transport system permease subunit